MKKLLICLSLLSLMGCTTINKITDILPKKHDPVLASYFVDTKLKIDSLSCDKTDDWKDAIQIANRLAAYAEFRRDPQKDNAMAIPTNLISATNDKTTCIRYLNVVKIRLDILSQAWSQRR